MNKKVIVIAVLIIVFFVSAIAETVSYYNGEISNKKSKIASLNAQIANQNNEVANLTSQISNLTAKVTNLTSANLLASLQVSEVSPMLAESFLAFYTPFYYLFISGNVHNVGVGTAYNAGLHVVAYSATGTLEVNMTVPLAVNVAYGTDNATDSIGLTSGDGSTQLGILSSGQTATIELDIFHEGTVSNWTVTPVWTNTP